MTQPELNGSVHLSMANDDRRPRFATLLTDLGYSVTEGVDEVPPQADLCILDPEGARRVADSLQDSQRSARSARTPPLLVIYSPEDDAMAGFSEELIDDVLVAPFDRTETRYRIMALLRSRRLSLAATTHTRRYRDLVSELSEGVFHLRQGRIEYVNESGDGCSAPISSRWGGGFSTSSTPTIGLTSRRLSRGRVPLARSRPSDS